MESERLMRLKMAWIAAEERGDHEELARLLSEHRDLLADMGDWILCYVLLFRRPEHRDQLN